MDFAVVSRINDCPLDPMVTGILSDPASMSSHLGVLVHEYKILRRIDDDHQLVILYYVLFHLHIHVCVCLWAYADVVYIPRRRHIHVQQQHGLGDLYPTTTYQRVDIII